jgi:hypothetical protein
MRSKWYPLWSENWVCVFKLELDMSIIVIRSMPKFVVPNIEILPRQSHSIVSRYHSAIVYSSV